MAASAFKALFSKAPQTSRQKIGYHQIDVDREYRQDGIWYVRVTFYTSELCRAFKTGWKADTVELSDNEHIEDALGDMLEAISQDAIGLPEAVATAWYYSLKEQLAAQTGE